MPGWTREPPILSLLNVWMSSMASVNRVRVSVFSGTTQTYVFPYWPTYAAVLGMSCLRPTPNQPGFKAMA